MIDHGISLIGSFDFFKEHGFIGRGDLNQEFILWGFACHNIFVFDPVIDHVHGYVEYCADFVDRVFVF